MEWLAEQQDLSAENPSHEAEKTPDAALILKDTINVNHLTQNISIINKFLPFTSGAIGIVCPHGSLSLSVIYPGSSRPPQILSAKGKYWSAVFMMNLGKVCLAATCSNTICLWNLEDNTSSIVYKQKYDKGKSMNLCVIDDRTVTQWEVTPSGDGCHKIYILMMNTQPWSLSSMLVVRGIELIQDMCYMKTTDGTACLLLSCPFDGNVQVVEIVGGRIRWKVGEQEIGREFYPWSNCIDENNTVYVADTGQHRIHILSGENGSVIRSINLMPFGVIRPNCVRVYEEHIYIGHEYESNKYQINKFTKPTDW